MFLLQYCNYEEIYKDKKQLVYIYRGCIISQSCHLAFHIYVTQSDMNNHALIIRHNVYIQYPLSPKWVKPQGDLTLSGLYSRFGLHSHFLSSQ